MRSHFALGAPMLSFAVMPMMIRAKTILSRVLIKTNSVAEWGTLINASMRGAGVSTWKEKLIRGLHLDS